MGLDGGVRKYTQSGSSPEQFSSTSSTATAGQKPPSPTLNQVSSFILTMAEIQAQLQAHLQTLSDEYQKLQQDLQGVVESRQKLEGQKEENLGVKKEFENLEEDETIYKLVGPVLLKQDQVEAESTVKGRLDFITGEISRQEDQIKETQEKIEKKKLEIIQLQAAAQAAAQPQGKGKEAA
ncbi:Prefoldin [Stachybotrys elegans]|uniref:Prefoldin n=1 Tax=Stachybotrys elegans TaxID=80388 RepID=A0A8K0SVG3_9HYPO|nr:Prefoldin [Stachybotrys elegans]